MDIVLPSDVSYRPMKTLMSSWFEATAIGDDLCCRFDFGRVEWVNLPELVSLLAWSTKLIRLGKKVEWIFRHPRLPYPDADRVRDLAKHVLGQEGFSTLTGRIHVLWEGAQNSSLTSRQRRGVFSKIRHDAMVGRVKDRQIIEDWLTHEEVALDYLDLISYLRRYDLFSVALVSGITVVPDHRGLPGSTVIRTPDTACMELRSILTQSDVERTVDDVSPEKDLSRILGEFGSLDVVTRGALSKILVAEIGHNIIEHSGASRAWICTRLVARDNVKGRQTSGDPAIARFREMGNGFLEVIICDNGKGLTAGLDRVLEADPRELVRNRYKRDPNGSFCKKDCIDYAFDRLSSTKRPIEELIHLPSSGQLPLRAVASGLYWVWNVVRRYHGVLSIQTGDLHAWYDLTCDAAVGPEWPSVSLMSDEYLAPFPGTMMRICLPLADPEAGQEPGLDTTSARRVAVSRKELQAIESHVKVFWAGDQSQRSEWYDEMRGQSDSTLQLRLSEEYEPRDTWLLRSLVRYHAQLEDGDIMVIDLCGVRRKWTMRSVNLLCHFFVEFNFTSPVGRSAVVLWNVPVSEESLFESAVGDAIGMHGHLSEFRRVCMLIRDDGEARFFCGWTAAERLLGTLVHEPELSLSEIGALALSGQDQDRFVSLVSLNPQLLSLSHGDRVSLRAWPPNVCSSAFEEGLRWLGGLVDREVAEGGIRRVASGAYYRLPSTGLLVRQFYQFEAILSKHEDCARVMWLVNEIVQAIAGESRSLDYIVSVSRSTMELARHLALYYRKSRPGCRTRPLVASTVEQLRVEAKGKNIAGSAVVVTDVISSGTLCSRIAGALPGMDWLGTVALLDTRESVSKEGKELKSLTLYPGLVLDSTCDCGCGPVYPLVQREVPKVEPLASVREPTVPIDTVNVCPMRFPEIGNARLWDVWAFLENRPEVLRIGHFEGENRHHYVYYVRARHLLDTAGVGIDRSLLDLVADAVMADLTASGYDPNETIVMHPPCDTSYGEDIAREVQRRTGALYLLPIYRERVAGQWRFSPFVERGISVAGSTVVVVDDGSNTGETIMAMLDGATFGRPRSIRAYVALSRLAPHKMDLLRRLEGLRGVPGGVSVRFAVAMCIPTFSPRTCPVCRFRRGLSQVESTHGLFARQANAMRDSMAALHTREVDDLEEVVASFAFRYGSALEVARLRENIELADFSTSAADAVKALLVDMKDAPGVDDVATHLLDLAFVVCTEPELLGTPIFAPHLESQLQATLLMIGKTPYENVKTYVGFALQLMCEMGEKVSSDPEFKTALRFWDALLVRNEFGIAMMSTVAAYAIGRVMSEPEPEGEPYMVLCHVLGQSLLMKRISRWADGRSSEAQLAEAFSPICARELLAIGIPGMHSRISAAARPPSSEHLVVTVKTTAAAFRSHANEMVGQHVRTLQRFESVAKVDLAVAVHELLVAFDNLHGLRSSLCEIETDMVRTIGQQSGTDLYWNHPELDEWLVKFGGALMEVGESIGAPAGIAAAARRLSESWGHLSTWVTRAFDEIFPEVYESVGDAWVEASLTGDLPSQVFKPLRAGGLKNRRQRVFIPRMLLLRFLKVVTGNLKTAAFVDWRQELVRSEAWAQLEIGVLVERNGCDLRRVYVRVSDNGRLHREISGSNSHAQPRGGSGRGLADVRRIAEAFGATLEWHDSEDGMVVDLKLLPDPGGKGGAEDEVR